MNVLASPRQQIPIPGRAGRVIAIASGKGGVGKTWLAVTLAHLLAARQTETLLFDGDFGLANIDLQLGLTPACDLSDVASGRLSLGEAVLRYPGPGGSAGFGIVAGCSGASVLAGLTVPALDSLLDTLRHLPGYDRILMDLGAGIDRMTRRLAAWADTLLVVTTEEPTALADAYAVLKLHARDRVMLGGSSSGMCDTRIVVNQAGSVSAGERAYATLARACTNFLDYTPPLLGIVRKDASVGEAIRRQSLISARSPHAPAVADLERIADRLCAI